VTPIYASSAFYYDQPETLDAVFGGERPGFVYSRYANPTVAAMEQAVASLEGAETAVGFASGMAALHAALLAAGVGAGKTVVAAQDLYGATRALLATVLSRQGVQTVFVDATDTDAVRLAVEQHRPVAVLIETVSNPLLKLVDVPAVAALAQGLGALLIVDNTFASPALFQPIKFGADFAVHSATKYLAGHGDSTGGVIVCAKDRRQELEMLLRNVGGVMSPFEGWLILRGIKTLPLRMRQHWSNAARVAAWLQTHPAISTVHYPGLPGHPQHALADRLFEGHYGGVVAFALRDATREAVFRLLRSLRVIVPATTLGDVYSEVLYPAMSSHRALTPEQRASVGITDGHVRLSVGIEDVEDIIADLALGLT
jgi:cystathionine gamma-synthase/methionine-gamma-lyase